MKGGEPVVWDPWQLDRISRPLLGLVWKDTGRRVKRRGLMVSGRGNAKTTKGAALSLFFLLAVGERNPEIDIYAKNRPQAGRLFRVIVKFVMASKELDAALNVSTHLKYITVPVTGGELFVRTGEPTSEVGAIPSLAIVDELMSQPSGDLFGAVVTSLAKRPDSLMLSFTTPSIGPESFAQDEYLYAKAVMADPSLDPRYHPMIWEADADDDVFSPKTWAKANPALESGFLEGGEIQQLAERARREPDKLHELKVYYCALWPDAGHGFINMTLWDEGAGILPSDEELSEMLCFVGIDMGGWDDLSSACFLFYDPPNERCYALWKHWSTGQNFGVLNDFTSGKWEKWVNSPNCKVDIQYYKHVDGQEVADWVAETAVEKGLNVISIGVDSYRSGQMMRLLGEDEGHGFHIQNLAQGGRSMQAGSERVQDVVASGSLTHNGDPVARWCASNATVQYDKDKFPRVLKPDPNENRTKIDAVMALCFAADRWLWWEREQQPHVPDEGWLPWGDVEPDDDEPSIDEED